MQARLVEREDPFAFQAPLLGRLGGAGDHGLRQAGQVFFLVEDEGEVVVLLEDVLAEFLGQDRELLVDLAELGFLGLVEVRAAADEVLVGFLEEPGLFGGEAELVSSGR